MLSFLNVLGHGTPRVDRCIGHCSARRLGDAGHCDLILTQIFQGVHVNCQALFNSRRMQQIWGRGVAENA